MEQSARTRRLVERHRKEREKANHNSPLFKLAPELRNRIFAFALPSDETFTVDPMTQFMKIHGKQRRYPSVYTASEFQRVFGITQVCRQIRAETLQVAYASSTFTLPLQETLSIGDAKRWVSSRPSKVLPAISKMALHSEGENDGDWCGSIHVVFDFQLKTAEVLMNGCCPSCNRLQERNTPNYRELVQQDRPSSMPPRERLVDLIDELRRIFRRGAR